MHAIASLLDERHSSLVRQIWKRLEDQCSLDEMRRTPFPHFSWNVASGYDFELLEKELAGWAHRAKPFSVVVSSLGVFSGAEPVFYLALVKNNALLDLHADLWEHTAVHARELSSFYQPENWVPHITLAQPPITGDGVSCASRMLAFESFDWRIQIDNLAVIYQEADQVGRCRQVFRFGRGT